MPTVAESLGKQSQLRGGLDAALNVLSENQTVTFVRYTKVILPLDGMVYWLRADKLSPSALLNTSAQNAFATGGPQSIVTPATTVIAPGSLHYTTDGRQDEDETIAVHRVVFTSEKEVQALAEVAPQSLYFATLPDGNRYSFGGRQSFYEQAGLWHYVGDAVYPAFESQLIEFPNQIDLRNVVVSNSLPIWLAMDLTNPPLGWPRAQAVPLYPSFLVPDNLPPPYGAVHIPADAQWAIQAAARFGPTLSRDQLVRESVHVTLYGLRNFNVMDFVDYVVNYSVRTEQFGIMNIPIVRDEKRTQLELSAIAMKKRVTFEVNYYQSRVRDVARQFILSVVPSFDIDYEPPGFGEGYG